MVLGVSEDVSGLPKSEEEVKMEKVFAKTWASFAADPKAGLKGLGWPEYAEGGDNLVRLGYGGKGGVEFVTPEIYDGVCRNVTVEG